MKHEGFSANRLHPDFDAPREVAFADAWRALNARRRDGSVHLGYLIPGCTERDAQVAATVVQWLGTNVGMSFLRGVVEVSPDVKRFLT